MTALSTVGGRFIPIP